MADYLLRIFIPTIAIGSASAGVLTAIFSFYPEHLFIEIGFGATVLLPWFFYRRGDPLRGIAYLVIAPTAASVAAVLFTGGIFEPAYIVLIAILTMAAWFISNRAVVLFVLGFLGLGLFASQLMKVGVIPPKVLPDGDWYVFVITGVALVVAVTITTVRSLFRDVLMDLAQLRAEQHRVADNLTRLTDTANAPIIGIDANGRVNEWNQAAVRPTGFTKLEVLGKGLVDEFVTDAYKDSVGEVLQLALGGQETANYEFPLFTKQGDRVDVLLNSTTRRDATGSVIGVVGVGQDITERKRAQIALEDERAHLTVRVAERTAELTATNSDLAAAARSKDEFLASMSHELRTPLNVILNMSELI